MCAAAESLDLRHEPGGGRFDAVLLASHLVNNGDPQVRRGLLRTCRRHVADGGRGFVQREAEDLHRRVPREGRVGDRVVRVVSAEPTPLPHTSRVHVVHDHPDVHFTQTFLSYRFVGDASNGPWPRPVSPSAAC